MLRVVRVFLCVHVLVGGGVAQSERGDPRPNVVFLIADDWSYPHAGALGDRVVKTPAFDRLCEEGVHFTNAYVAAPSCSPSRAAILAGQHPFRLGGAANLWGSIAADVPLITDLLHAEGYLVGKFGKGHWPSHHLYRDETPLPEGHERFAAFLARRAPDQPFFYWFGGQDPHRPYEAGVGVASGLDPARVQLPACLPDDLRVRADVCDYYWEVQRFDRQCDEILRELERAGEAERTIVVMTSDNGMPFPRCKATLYDLGTRVPLAVRWPGRIGAGRSATDFVGLQDLAPTILEACGVETPASMNARSLLDVLVSAQETGRVDARRDHAVTGMEGHVEHNPQRALRTDRFLLVRNFYEGEWPVHPTSEFNFNIDPSPTKSYMLEHRDEPAVRTLYELAFEARPAIELYDLEQDPEQLRSVAADPAYAGVRTELERRLTAELEAMGDPRATGDAGVFERHRREDRAADQALQRAAGVRLELLHTSNWGEGDAPVLFESPVGPLLNVLAFTTDSHHLAVQSNLDAWDLELETGAFGRLDVLHQEGLVEGAGEGGGFLVGVPGACYRTGPGVAEPVLVADDLPERGDVFMGPGGQQLVASGLDSLATRRMSVQLVDVTRGAKARLEPPDKVASVTAVAWSPDGARVAVAWGVFTAARRAAAGVTLYDRSGELVRTWTGGGDEVVRSMEFSFDARSLTVANGGLRRLDVESGDELARADAEPLFWGNVDPVTGISVQEDGLTLWDAARLRRARTVSIDEEPAIVRGRPKGPVLRAALSPKCDLLAVGTVRGLRIYRIRP